MTNPATALLARQVTRSKEVHGTLTRVYCAHSDNCLLLIFDNGQWAHYRAYGDDDKYIEFEADHPDWEEFLHAGLMTNDDYLAQRACEREEAEQEQQQRELEIFARLKAKYEN